MYCESRMSELWGILGLGEPSSSSVEGHTGLCGPHLILPPGLLYHGGLSAATKR